MKNKLLGIGLAGLIGLIGTNLSALEVNEKGFPVPDKTSAEFIGRLDHRDYDEVVIKKYRRTDGTVFNEYSWYNKVGGYTIFPNITEPSGTYTIEDNNCDGVFETKYEGLMKPEAIPDCYYKK